MSKIYAIYDMKDYEQCVFLGTMKEIADFLNCKCDSLYSYLSRRKAGKTELIKHKYELVEIKEEEEKSVCKKTDKEIFQEIINLFMPEQHNFEIYKEKKKKEITIINEKWKTIDSFNYSVSNYGRIKNNKSDKIKTLRKGLYGYQVNLWNNSKGTMFTLSRLVAHYFIRPVKANERVIHIDQDIRNNYYQNLKIVNK